MFECEHARHIMSSSRVVTAVVPTTSSAIFSFILDVVVFVFMIFVMGLMIANIVYFRRLAADKTQTHISHGAAVSMIGISIFLLIIAIVGMIYYAFLTIYQFFQVFQSMDNANAPAPAPAAVSAQPAKKPCAAQTPVYDPYVAPVYSAPPIVGNGM